MLRGYVGYIFYFTLAACQDYFDFQLYHNLTAERLQDIGENGQRKSIGKSRRTNHGFGRVLTWNIKSFSTCTGDDDVPRLKEAICSVLLSADVVALQEAENLDISCLPCHTELKRDYAWLKGDFRDEFKILVKSKFEKLISLSKVGQCATTENEMGEKREFLGSRQSLYQQFMRALKVKEEEIRLKNSRMYDKVNTSDSANMQNKSANEAINSRFTLSANQSSAVKPLLHFPPNNSDTHQDDVSSRFSPTQTSDEKAAEKKVALTRFLLESEQNKLTAGKDNFTNVQNFTDKQVERFLAVDTEANEINELNEKEILRKRLYKSKERLNNTPIGENRNERFKVLDDKLTNIEKEIDEIITSNDTSSFPVKESVELGAKKHGILVVNHNVTSNFSLESDTTKDDPLPNESKKLGDIVKQDTTSFTKSKINRSVGDWYKFDISSGSKKSTVQRHNSRLTLDDDSNIDPPHEKSIVALPNHRNVVLYKSIIDATGHGVIKRAIQLDGERRFRSPNLRRYNEPTADDKNEASEIHYTIASITSDLNSGERFLLVNLKLPRESVYQRRCFDNILVDLMSVIREEGTTMKTLLMGDFHFDQLTDHDSTGSMPTTLTNLHFNNENYHPVISYDEKDPITTIYGRRFDNIVTNVNIRRNTRVIGPDLPVAVKTEIPPFALQRLYNNYMTAMYTNGSIVADSIYQCIKAYQIAGKGELNNEVCEDTWVPSSYISDHLPLEITANFKMEGRATAVELKLGSWNIQGGSFKQRMRDTSVKKMFLKALNNYHLLIFNEFPSDENVFDGSDEVDGGSIARLTQGDLTTEFGIFIHQDVKDGETDMYALRKKIHSEGEDENEEAIKIVSTVGLFIPKLVVETRKIRPCIYTVKTSEKETPSFGSLSILLDAIYKDVRARDCDFKMLMASLNFTDSFDIASEIYKKYKFKMMICGVPDVNNRDTDRKAKSRGPADYFIFIGGNRDVSYSNCTIGLPGDEKRRGIESLNDFRELSTHYPLSINMKRNFMSFL